MSFAGVRLDLWTLAAVALGWTVVQYVTLSVLVAIAWGTLPLPVGAVGVKHAVWGAGFLGIYALTAYVGHARPTAIPADSPDVNTQEHD